MYLCVRVCVCAQERHPSLWSAWNRDWCVASTAAEFVLVDYPLPPHTTANEIKP